MHILGVQFASLVSLFAGMVSVFLLPYWWVSRRPESFGGSRYQVALSLANCLSGGVFIATFFIGLMPEVRAMYAEVFAAYHSDFPITELVIFAGFLLALAIEQSVLGCKERRVPADDIKEHSLDYDSDSPSRTMVKDSESILGGHHGHSHDISGMLAGGGGVRLGMLMVSLGIHSLFEGLALGLQTSVGTLVNLVLGVAVHELLVAFAMGVNVSRLRLPPSTALKLALFFAASIPAGQMVGLLIGHYQSTGMVAVSATLQGLAAGTFIHVTFLEVIPAEFQESGPRLLKVFFLGLGFMLLLLCNLAMHGVVQAI